MILSRRIIYVCTILLVVFLAACGNNEQQEETDEQNSKSDGVDVAKQAITIGLDPYDYATVPAYLSKEILEREGYEASIQVAEVGILFASLANEDVDVFIDVWTPNLHKSYLEEYDGQFDIIGTLYADAPVGMAVPTFMENVNSTEDLNEYKDEFDGMLYTVDAGSGGDYNTRELIKAYDLDFEVTNSSAPAMIAQAEKLISENKAVAFHAWRPHTMFRLLDIKMLEDPLDLWGSDSVKVGAVFDLADKAPEAHTLYSNMEFTLDEIEEWLLAMELEDKTPEELAIEWVENNEEKVNRWLEK